MLELLCEALQPTPTLWGDAQQKYNAVGSWLAAPESKLNFLNPDIKYQGSALIETVVRPWAREEFDVDLLLHSEIGQVSAPESHGRVRIGRGSTCRTCYVPSADEASS